MSGRHEKEKGVNVQVLLRCRYSQTLNLGLAFTVFSLDLVLCSDIPMEMLNFLFFLFFFFVFGVEFFYGNAQAKIHIFEDFEVREGGHLTPWCFSLDHASNINSGFHGLQNPFPRCPYEKVCCGFWKLRNFRLFPNVSVRVRKWCKLVFSVRK